MDTTAVIVESLSHSGALHYTYNELVSRSKELASTIQRLTSRSTLHIDYTGVFCENSFELLVSLLSVLSIGHVYVPLTPHNLDLITTLPISLVLVRAEQLTQYLLLSADPSDIDTQCFSSGIIICHYDTSHIQDSVSCPPPQQCTSLYDLFARSAQHDFCPLPEPHLAQSSNRTAYVLQSSGTTGQPKTIRVPHASLIPNILDLSRIFSLSPGDTCFLSAPPSFDPSLVQIFTCLTSGCTLLIVPPPPFPSYPCLFLRHNLTILQCTPSLFYTFSLTQCTQLLGPTSPLRVLAFGGENCPPVSVLRRWKHSDNRTLLYNLYGITEVSCWSTCHSIQLHDQNEWDDYNANTEAALQREFDDISALSELVPIGLPLSESRVELRLTRPDELLGEIWVGGATRRCEVGGDGGEEMRETGDVGIEGSKGGFYCLGRRDTQLKRLGHRMNLLSVERCVGAIPGVESCVVRRDKGRIVAFLVTDSDWIDVRKRIQTDIPSRHRPDFIRILHTIPLTPHGKLDIHSLLSTSSHPPTAPSFPEAVGEFFSNELSILSLTPCPLPLSHLGVDSFELVSLANRLQDLMSQYSQNLKIESLYDVLSSHPSNLLPDTILSRAEPCELDLPSTKRPRTDITPTNTLETPLDGIVSLRRGAVSRPQDTLPFPLLPPPNPSRLFLVWSHDTGQCVDSSPLLCYHPLSQDLTLYVGSHSRNFSALRASDGAILWSRELDDRVESSPVLSRCGCYLVVGSYSGGVWVLEREGGGVHWVYSTGSEPVKSSPCMDPSTGLVWVGTHSATLVALDVLRKECVHRVDTNSGSCYSSPVADPVLGAVYVGTNGGDLLRVSGRSGAIRWRCSFKKALFSSPALLPGRGVLVGSVGGVLYCVDTEGAVRWSHDANGPLFSSACVVQLSQTLHLFIGTHNQRVLSLSSAGELEWEYGTDSDIFSIPFALPCSSHTVNGIIVVAMINGTILLLDFAGVRLCSYKLPSKVFSSPVLAGTRVFVGCRDNCVYCLDISTQT